jgi:hypothetical protein
MKKILLLGDSIRLGYGEYVKAVLSEIAETYAPKENCAFAQYMYRWLHVWKENEGYPSDMDLVHWNVGLWDVLRSFGEDTFTSPEYYAEMLKRLQKRIAFLFPNAKQIFATSTSVVESEYEPPYQRFNLDIEKFNAIAIETLAPLGVVINDLYSLTKSAPSSCRSDMTHFYTVDGIQLLGEKVVKTVCENLEIPFSKIKEVGAKRPNISKELMGL